MFIKTNYKCFYCDISLTPENRSIDHIKSLQSGGTNDLDNLIGACIPCNNAKGKREYFFIYRK